MIRFKIRSILFYAILSMYVLSITGCTYDYQDELEGGDTGKKVSLRMTIPAFDIPKTRALNGVKEATVKQLDLLVFDQSTPAKLIAHSSIYSDIDQKLLESQLYEVTFSVNQSLMNNAGTLVVVANAPMEVSSTISKYPVNTGTKVQVLSDLKFATTKATNNNTYKWNVSTSYTAIPMYGEINVASAERSGQLKRMLAAIDIENKVNGSVFRLQEIHLANFKTAGYVAPAWNATNGTLLKETDSAYPYSRNLNPMVPTQTAPGEMMVYTYNQPANAAGPLLAGEIYTYEAPKATADGDVNATCLIVKGLYEGEEYYYRIDFTQVITNESTKVTTVEYMPLYRNHKYIVTIEAAEGIGYKTLDEALRSTTVLSNLKTTLLVIDMNGVNDVVFDGQYYLGVNEKESDVLWYENKILNQTIKSDYVGTWTAQITNAGTGKWLRFANTSDPVVTGVFPTNTTLSLDVGTLQKLRPADVTEEGEILLTAGRLRMKLTVKRTSVSALFAASNVVLGSGGKLIFAVNKDENKLIPANSQGVLFKWGSLIGFDPLGNLYAPGTHVVHNPTSTTPSTWGGLLKGWDKVPYAHSNFYFTTPVAADPFKAYGSNSGFVETRGIGDICRYISAKGWVDGNWRMPSRTEYQKVHEEHSDRLSYGAFTNVTGSIGYAANGMAKVNSGWLIGEGVRRPVSATDIESPPTGSIFLPASGYRYPEGDGNAVLVGSYGYYWTTTLTDATDKLSAYTYWLNSKTSTDIADVDRSYAFPIRCIRDN